MANELKIVENFEMYENLKNGDRVTAKYWPTEDIKLIKMTDGSYALGIDVYYKDELGNHFIKTHRIHLTKDNVPYIEIGESFDFTNENCVEKITSHQFSNSNGYRHQVQGIPLLTLTDGSPVKNKSVLIFPNSCINSEYFQYYHKTAGFNNKGLSLIVKYVENAKNRDALDARVAPVSENEKESLKQKMSYCFEKFLDGEINSSQMTELIEKYSSRTKHNGLSDDVIVCDLKQLDKDSQPTPGPNR